MSSGQQDRNLLFGIVALQFDFVTRDQLVAAMNAWVLDKKKSLADLLVERDALTASRRAMLEPLVEEHVRQHQGDPQRSLAALSSVDGARQALDEIKDPDLQASLRYLTLPPPTSESPQNYATIDPPAATRMRFRILRQHAKGGLGVVFVAHDQEVNRQVALKEIQSHCARDPDARQRFELEAEITGGLEHPGIVPVYGLGHYDDGRPYYAMRFIKGDSLKEAVDAFHAVDKPGRDPAERNLALRALLRRFIDVCNAIDYAHSKGVLHRDLKPGNIMLGKFGETLVVDWGLAKASGKSDSITATDLREAPLAPTSGSNSAPTQMGSAIGTPGFMPPEQAAGRHDLLGPASDVYSLGATLYYLLTGKSPFERGDIAEILKAVQKGDFIPPRKIAPSIPAGVEAICLKAMALQPADRYPSAASLRQDLDLWLDDAPVSAWREPFSVKARRWLNRHRTLATTTAVGLIAAVVFLAILAAVTSSANERLAKLAEDERLAKNDAEEKRQQAEAAELRAKDEAEVSTAVRKFLQNDLLRFASAQDQAESGGAVDPKLSVRDLLLRASSRIAGQFDRQPRVEQELQMTIGTALREIGLPRESIPHLERARALASATLGADHVDTLGIQINLGNSYSEAGRLTEALKLRESTLAAFKAKLGPDHNNTLICMDGVAGSYVDLGRREEAMKLQEETLALRTAKFGPNAFNTLNSMHNLANSYDEAGLLEKALKLRQEVAAKRMATLGPDHPATLLSMTCLAVSFDHSGRRADALALREELLAIERAKLGPDHPHTIDGMSNLANSYARAGRFAEALKLHQETLDLRMRILGPDHPDTVSTKHNLAVFYVTADRTRTKEAIKLLDEAIGWRKAKLGPDHPDTLASIGSLANCYSIDGKHDEAIKLHEETLARRRAKLGLDNPDTMNGMVSLAFAYESAGRPKEAIKLREEVLTLKQAKFGPVHFETLLSMNSLAVAYAENGRRNEAVALLEVALKASQDKLGPDDPNSLGIMNNLAKNLEDWNRPKDALKIREEIYSRRKAKLGPVHLETLQDMNSLAITNAMLGRKKQAVALFEEMVPLAKANLGADHPQTLTGLQNLAKIYAQTGRMPDAVKVLEEILSLRSAKLGPDDASVNFDMNSLADAYINAGQTAKGLATYAKLLDRVKAKVGPEHPDTIHFLGKLAVQHLMAKNFDESRKYLKESLDVRTALLARKPDDKAIMIGLAVTYNYQGSIEQETLNFSAARTAYGKCEKLLESANLTNDPELSRELKIARDGIAFLDDAEKALVDLDFVLAKSADARHELMSLRMHVFADKKDRENLLATTKAMTDLAAKDAADAYDAACGWSLAARLVGDDAKKKEEYSLEAMRLLRLTPIGPRHIYRTSEAFVAHMAQDRDLDAIRDREDFRTFLNETKSKR